MHAFDTAEHAIASFEYLTGLRVTVHDLDRSIWPYLRPDRFNHRFYPCLKVKNSPYAESCARLEPSRVLQRADAATQGCCHVCHAGLVEWAMPVIGEHGPRWVFYAGQRMPGPGLTLARRYADSAVHTEVWSPSDQLPEPVGEEEAQHILEALRQLVGRVVAWHRDFDRLQHATGSDAGTREVVIRRFVHEKHRFSNVSLEQLAQRLGISTSRAGHVVRETCGKPFTDLITEARMRTAADLLRHTNQTVDEIARRTGYRDSTHLYRRFRQHTGHSPHAYRKLTSMRY